MGHTHNAACSSSNGKERQEDWSQVPGQLFLYSEFQTG